jgi:hypothetical protein
METELKWKMNLWTNTTITMMKKKNMVPKNKGISWNNKEQRMPIKLKAVEHQANMNMMMKTSQTKVE